MIRVSDPREFFFDLFYFEERSSGGSFMSNNQIGSFIQLSRKEKGMTQKDLAEQIGVSDKTISKWENGNSVPDTEILTSLCQALDITVNELLSGEKLPVENYSMKAEENMMNLLKENENNRKNSVGQLVVGCVLGVLTLVLLFCSMYGSRPNMLTFFVDAPSLLGVVLVCVSLTMMSGAKGKKEVLQVVQKALIPAGVFVALIAVVVLMGNLEDPSTIGPNLAVAVLSIVYAVFFYLILIPVNHRLEKKDS